jgi:hypothetical protein
MPKQSLLIQCALVILVSLLLLWTVPATADQPQAAADTVKKVYICGCGPAGGCERVASEPATAPCGKPLVEKQVLKEDADYLYVCGCPQGCSCGLSESEPTRCSCGQELRAYPQVGKPGCVHGAPEGCPKRAVETN